VKITQKWGIPVGVLLVGAIISGVFYASNVKAFNKLSKSANGYMQQEDYVKAQS